MITWDDYRLVLAIARARGLPGAAASLKVTLSTVFRRLERIEDTLQTRLFDRLRGSYEPTDTGIELIRAAERMEHEALHADRIISGRDQKLTGVLRITATDALAVCFLARHLPQFHLKHPGISIEILSDDHLLSLAGREADLALRPKRPIEDTLVARKIATIRWGIYARHELSRSIGETEDLASLSRYGFINWIGAPASKWFDEMIPNNRASMSSSSLITNAELAAQSDQLVSLPCLLGSEWHNLSPVIAPLPEPVGQLWVATHEDMRRNARVKALFDFIVRAAESDKELFEGSIIKD